jgi:hypothetical protein
MLVLQLGQFDLHGHRQLPDMQLQPSVLIVH